jgi:hypothetical protein
MITSAWGIQEAAPPDNPYPVKGWEVIGIEPDVKVSRTEALHILLLLASTVGYDLARCREGGRRSA